MRSDCRVGSAVDVVTIERRRIEVIQFILVAFTRETLLLLCRGLVPSATRRRRGHLACFVRTASSWKCRQAGNARQRFLRLLLSCPSGIGRRRSSPAFLSRTGKDGSQGRGTPGWQGIGRPFPVPILRTQRRTQSSSGLNYASLRIHGGGTLGNPVVLRRMLPSRRVEKVINR